MSAGGWVLLGICCAASFVVPMLLPGTMRASHALTITGLLIVMNMCCLLAATR